MKNLSYENQTLNSNKQHEPKNKDQGKTSETQRQQHQDQNTRQQNQQKPWGQGGKTPQEWQQEKQTRQKTNNIHKKTNTK